MARKINVGVKPQAGGGGGGMFWGPKVDQVHEVTLLANVDELVSVDQCTMWDFNPAPSWVYCGPDDPSHDLGLKPGYRAFMPVLVKDDESGEPRLWSMPISVHRQLCVIGDMDELKGMVVRVKKTGAGMKTKYVLVSTGRRTDIKKVAIPSPEDIISRLGPEDRESIIQLIEERSGRKFSELTTGKKDSDSEEL